MSVTALMNSVMNMQQKLINCGYILKTACISTCVHATMGKFRKQPDCVQKIFCYSIERKINIS